jgi:hypothetical protein
VLAGGRGWRAAGDELRINSPHVCPRVCVPSAWYAIFSLCIYYEVIYVGTCIQSYIVSVMLTHQKFVFSDQTGRKTGKTEEVLIIQIIQVIAKQIYLNNEAV